MPFFSFFNKKRQQQKKNNENKSLSSSSNSNGRKKVLPVDKNGQHLEVNDKKEEMIVYAYFSNDDENEEEEYDYDSDGDVVERTKTKKRNPVLNIRVEGNITELNKDTYIPFLTFKEDRARTRA